jgi:regulator of protease activity HflC (stomatin/prohibitin superfamily)
VFVIQAALWIIGFGGAAYIIWRAVVFWVEKQKEAPSPLPYFSFVEAIAVLLVCGGIASSFGEVPAGFRGVVLRFGGTTGEVKQPGLYTVVPFITTVVLMNVQVQAYSADAAAASADLQNVQTKVTLNYTVDTDKVVDVYNRLNQDYQDRIIAPAIQEATKAATAHFTAEELITKRPEARNLLEETLATRLGEFDMHIAAMSITNFEFSQDFSNAIEAKVVAFQNYLKAQNQLKQAQVDAQTAIATARGDATANTLSRQAISELTVQYDAIQKWDGHYPYVVGNGTTLIGLNALMGSNGTSK